MVPFRPNLVVALFSRGKWPKTSKFQNSPKNGKRKQQMSNPPFWGVFHKVFRVFSFLRSPIFCHLKKGHFRQKCPLLGTNLTPFFLHAPHTSAYLGHLPSLFGDTCQNICRSIVKKWNQAMKKVIWPKVNHIYLTQFKTTPWTEHNTHWQWNKFLKMMTLVSRLKRGNWSQLNATNVTMHFLRQAIWGHIWKNTVKRSQTNATNANFHPLMRALWGHIWKDTMEKSWTSAANVTMPLIRQAI